MVLIPLWETLHILSYTHFHFFRHFMVLVHACRFIEDSFFFFFWKWLFNVSFFFFALQYFFFWVVLLFLVWIFFELGFQTRIKKKNTSSLRKNIFATVKYIGIFVNWKNLDIVLEWQIKKGLPIIRINSSPIKWKWYYDGFIIRFLEKYHTFVVPTSFDNCF